MNKNTTNALLLLGATGLGVVLLSAMDKQLADDETSSGPQPAWVGAAFFLLKGQAEEEGAELVSETNDTLTFTSPDRKTTWTISLKGASKSSARGRVTAKGGDKRLDLKITPSNIAAILNFSQTFGALGVSW